MQSSEQENRLLLVPGTQKPKRLYQHIVKQGMSWWC